MDLSLSQGDLEEKTWNGYHKHWKSNLMSNLNPGFVGSGRFATNGYLKRLHESTDNIGG